MQDLIRAELWDAAYSHMSRMSTRTGDDLPVVKDSASVLDAVKEITRKKIGMTAITNEANEVVGIFTEGDLRRPSLKKVGDIRPISIASVMTKHPSTTTADALAMEAAKVP